MRDPLGLELLLEGKIRGGGIRDAFNRVVQGIGDLSQAEGSERIKRIDIGPGNFDEVNTARLGCVLIA